MVYKCPVPVHFRSVLGVQVRSSNSGPFQIIEGPVYIESGNPLIPFLHVELAFEPYLEAPGNLTKGTKILQEEKRLKKTPCNLKNNL